MSSNTSYELEKMSRTELVGRKVTLSDGREGEIVHVEYESLSASPWSRPTRKSPARSHVSPLTG